MAHGESQASAPAPGEAEVVRPFPLVVVLAWHAVVTAAVAGLTLAVFARFTPPGAPLWEAVGVTALFNAMGLGFGVAPLARLRSPEPLAVIRAVFVGKLARIPLVLAGMFFVHTRLGGPWPPTVTCLVLTYLIALGVETYWTYRYIVAPEPLARGADDARTSPIGRVRLSGEDDSEATETDAR